MRFKLLKLSSVDLSFSLFSFYFCWKLSSFSEFRRNLLIFLNYSSTFSIFSLRLISFSSKEFFSSFSFSSSFSGSKMRFGEKAIVYQEKIPFLLTAFTSFTFFFPKPKQLSLNSSVLHTFKLNSFLSFFLC